MNINMVTSSRRYLAKRVSIVFFAGISALLTFFSGTLFTSAYFALFLVDTPTVETTLPSLGTTLQSFEVSADSAFTFYYDYGGEAPYKINRFSHCNAWDDNYECIDEAPNLCNYIGITPSSPQVEVEDVGFMQNANAIYARGVGQLNIPLDDTDTWNISITSPCFQGECPLGYDAIHRGTPLAPSLKGQTFKCDIYVNGTDLPPLARNFSSVAYAEGVSNLIEVSVVLTGELSQPALPPALAFATATPKGIWEDDGLQDGKGTASSTVFTFSTIYTSVGNIAPDDIVLHVYLPDLTDFATLPLFSDASGTPTLHDGDYRNGEQYVATSTFPKNDYKYVYEAHVGSSTLTFPNTTLFPTFKTGYSNVAFLPGHQASRLYHTNPDSNTEKQLWDPEFIHDNGDLYLNPDGTSVKSDIYIKTTPSNGVIDEAYGANVYKNFMSFIDTSVVGEGVIKEWEVLPYDWRLDFATLMETGKRDGDKVSYINGTTSTPFILEELRRLASTSDTGKVTIITHSNGGLLAKYILATLGASGDPLVGKVDKLIMVAPPQLGTPKAVAGLLHGDEIGIAKGFILRKSTARELGENMISAYNLLPSEAFFNSVQDPVILFDKSVNKIAQIGDLASTTIADEVQMAYFMLGRNGLWAEPPAGDTDTPNVLKSALLARATSTHALIDYWTPPQRMQVIQIAGWGLDTPKSISYDCGFVCSSLSSLDRDVMFTLDGDGTVVVPSAVAMSTSTRNVERLWINLPKHNDILQGSTRRNRNHADILEVEELDFFIKSLLQGGRNIDGSIVVTSKPAVTNESKRLRFQLHSPVSLHLYDSNGNHTGIVNTNGASGDMTFIEEKVPNSYYFEFGEAKYAGMSKDASATIKLKGEALGTFTFDIDEVAGDTTIASTTFVDIPVTASTTATLVIPSNGEGTTSVSQLAIDIDGDGTTDTTLIGGTIGVSTDQLTAILKGIVKTLMMPAIKKTSLLKKIDKLEKELAREHKNQKVEALKTKRAFDMVEDAIKRFQKKAILTADEVTELLSIVGQIKGLVIK